MGLPVETDAWRMASGLMKSILAAEAPQVLEAGPEQDWATGVR